MSPCVVDIELKALEHSLGQNNLHRVVIADAVGPQIGDVAELAIRTDRGSGQEAVKILRWSDDVRAFVAYITDLQTEILTQTLLDIKVPVLHVRSFPIPLNSADALHSGERRNVREWEAHESRYLLPAERNGSRIRIGGSI